MKILSIDTSSNICGVSILEDKNLICKLDSNTGRTHSENLMPMVDEAFKKANLSLKNIDLISCDIGPGSFTGLRIGIATAKAFLDSLDIPCVGISSLEVLAYSMISDIKDKDIVLSILDCKNDNCYFALYEKSINNNDGNLEVLIEPEAESIEACLSILKSYIEDNIPKTTLNTCTFTIVGDGSITYHDKIETTIENIFINYKFAPEEKNNIDSYYLGLAGLNHANSGFAIEASELLPLYLKKPQAQRQLEQNLKNQQVQK